MMSFYAGEARFMEYGLAEQRKDTPASWDLGEGIRKD